MTKKINEYMTIRLERDLHEKFAAFCANCEMTVSGAVNLLVKNTINEQKLPFQVGGDLEIEKAKKGEGKPSFRINVRIDKESRAAFADVCDKIGVSSGRAVKMFMKSCINTGTLPLWATHGEDEIDAVE